MAVTETDIREIQAKINPLLGQQAWGAALGVGSFITLEFGASRPPVNERGSTHGEWHLWVYCCAWRLEGSGEVLAASEDARPQLEAAIQHLNGLAIRTVEVQPPALETTITFDGGIVLRLFPIFTEGFEHWMLYTPDGNVLTIGPGTTWSYEKATR